MPEPLHTLVAAGLERGLFPGAAFRVLRLPNEILAEGVTGWAQEEPAIPVASDTIWDLASITKPLATATSLLLLAQEGQLHLEQDVSHFLDAPSLQGITLRHCLTHTSGLRPWEQFHSRGWSPEAILRRVRTSERQHPVGTHYAYSDLGYLLLGQVVERVTGERLSDFAARRVFGPLGMPSTRYLPPLEWRARIAATRCPDRQRVLVGEVHDGNCDALDGVAGHAGLFGTLDDLTTYGRMLLNEGMSNDGRLLSRLAARRMSRNQNPPGLSGQTLGWFTRPNGFLPAADFLPDDTFGHTGFTGTSLLLCPSERLLIVLLTNRVYMERDAAEFLTFRRHFHNAAAALI